MIKRLYSWHIKQRRFKLFKGSLLAPMKPSREPFRLFRGRQYFFAAEGQYVYEKAARRRFFRYLFLGIFLFIGFVWFAIESYKAWDIFGF